MATETSTVRLFTAFWRCSGANGVELRSWIRKCPKMPRISRLYGLIRAYCTNRSVYSPVSVQWVRLCRRMCDEDGGTRRIRKRQPLWPAAIVSTVNATPEDGSPGTRNGNR